MKKLITFVFALLLLISMLGCTTQEKQPEIIETVTTDFATYYQMSDGTWKTDTHTYQYRLEITGRFLGAKADETYVYLSNLENITFDQAWRASGLSSELEDYFSEEEALLVDMWVND